MLNNQVADFLNNSFKNMEYLYFNIDESGKVLQTSKIEKSISFNYLVCSKEIAAKIKLI